MSAFKLLLIHRLSETRFIQLTPAAPFNPILSLLWPFFDKGGNIIALITFHASHVISKSSRSSAKEAVQSGNQKVFIIKEKTKAKQPNSFLNK